MRSLAILPRFSGFLVDGASGDGEANE